MQFWRWFLATCCVTVQVVEMQADDLLTPLRPEVNWEAQLYLERGLHRFEDNPHAGLSWLMRALHVETDEESKLLQRLRIAMMARDVPRLVRFWPDAGKAEFSPKADLLAISSEKTIEFIDIQSQQSRGSITHPFPVQSIEFDHAGGRLVTICRHDQGDPLGRVWNLSDFSPVTEFVNLADQDFGLRVTPTLQFSADDSKLILVATATVGRWSSEMRAQVFDSQTFRSISPPFGHRYDIDASDYHRLSPDSLHLLVPGGELMFAEDAQEQEKRPEIESSHPQQYDLLTGKMMHPPLEHELHFYPFGEFGYSPDGKKIGTANDGTVKIWNTADGTLITSWEYGDDDPVPDIIFGANGQSLFVITNRLATQWDLDTREVLREWDHEGDFILSPDQKVVALDYTNRGSISVESLDSLRDIDWELPEAQRVGFSRTGKYLLHVPEGQDWNDSEIPVIQQIYETETGNALTPPCRFLSRGESAFSKDDRFYIAKDEFGWWLWDLDAASPAIEQFFPENQGSEVIFAMSPDRKSLFAMDEEYVVHAFDTQSLQETVTPVNLETRMLDGTPILWLSMLINSESDFLVMWGVMERVDIQGNDDDEFVFQCYDLKTGKAVHHAEVSGDYLDEEDVTAVALFGATQVLFFEPIRHIDTEARRETVIQSKLHLFDMQTGQMTRDLLSFSGTAGIADISAAGDRCLIVINRIDVQEDELDGWHALRIFDTKSWTDITPTLPMEVSSDWRSRLLPDGRRLMASSGEVYDIESGDHLQSPPAYTHGVGRPMFLDRLKGFAVFGSRRENDWTDSPFLRFYELDGEQTLAPGIKLDRRMYYNHRIALHPNHELLVTGGWDIQLWDFRRGQPITRKIDLTEDDLQIDMLEFSPDGRRLFIGADRRVFTLDMQSLIDDMPNDELLESWSDILSARDIDSDGILTRIPAARIIESVERIQDVTK